MSKHVLFIHHVSFMGGAERYLLSLIEVLPPEFKVHFICQEPGPLSQAIEQKGAIVHFMPLRAWRKPRFFFKNLLTVKSIISFCREHKIGLICSNNYRVTPYAYWPAKLLKIPCLTILQDFVDIPKLRRFSALSSDYLITVSDSITDSVKHSFKGRITRIYNGLDLDAFMKLSLQGDIREQFPSLKDKVIIGMIAQIVPIKGHKVFLKAMQEVMRNIPDVRCVIIGSSPSDEQLSAKDLQAYAQELGIADKIIFTGARNDVPALLKGFDILVHPALKEPFGRVVLEAMALSVAVIATKSGGPGEIIEDDLSGLLVPVNDHLRIADAVKGLLADKTRCKAMGLAAAERAKKFEINQTVAGIVPLLNRIFTESK